MEKDKINLKHQYGNWVTYLDHDITDEIRKICEEERDEQIKAVFGDLKVHIKKWEEKIWLSRQSETYIRTEKEAANFSDSSPATLFLWKSIPIK